ncbi:MAG: DUF3703 domain-containing protein, partial [Cryomorphaceae bacterium]
MPQKLKPFFRKEISDYRGNLQHGNLQRAWEHLERAH